MNPTAPSLLSAAAAIIASRPPAASHPRNGFQKLDKIKDVNRYSRQLEELTDKMRDYKWNGFQKLDKIKDVNCYSRQLEELTDKILIKDFERVSKDEAERTDPDTAKMLH